MITTCYFNKMVYFIAIIFAFYLTTLLYLTYDT